MKKTQAVKPLVDIAMTILLFVLMAYQLTGCVHRAKTTP